jgi:hypothetical protein
MQRRSISRAVAKALATKGLIPTLVRMLGADTAAVKVAAASTLHQCASLDRVITITRAGAMQPLLALLKEGTPDEQEVAAGAIGALVKLTKNLKLIVEADCFPSIVHLLSCGSPASRGYAVFILYTLSLHESHKSQLLEAGVVPLLAQQLTADDPTTRSTASKAIRILLTSLKGGSTQSTLTAAASLVLLLDEGPPTLQEAVVIHLHSYCTDKDVCGAFSAVGIFQPLVQMMTSGTDRAKEAAAGMLQCLARDPASKIAIAAAGAIPGLVQLLWEGTAATKEQATGALWNLAVNGDNQKFIAAEGAIPLLVQLLMRDSNSLKEAASGALANIAGEILNRTTIAAEGAIPLLVQLLRVGTAAAQEQAARALQNLAVDADNRKTIAAAGAIPLLLQLLRGGTEAGKAQATEVLANLAAESDSRKTIAAEGVVPIIQQALFGDHPPKQDVRLLCNLANDPALATQFVQEGFIPRLVQLTAVESPEVQKYAMLTIESIARSAPEHRPVIIEAGTFGPLQKLRDGDNEELKERAGKTLQALGRA